MSHLDRRMVQVEGLDVEGLAEIVAHAVQAAMEPYRKDVQALRDAALASQAFVDAHGHARVLGVTPQSVGRYVKEGLPYRQMTAGGKRLFYIPDVAQSLRRGNESASGGRYDHPT